MVIIDSLVLLNSKEDTLNTAQLGLGLGVLTVCMIILILLTGHVVMHLISKGKLSGYLGLFGILGFTGSVIYSVGLILGLIRI